MSSSIDKHLKTRQKIIKGEIELGINLTDDYILFINQNKVLPRLLEIDEYKKSPLYGLCTICVNKIPKERLKAINTDKCINCTK